MFAVAESRMKKLTFEELLRIGGMNYKREMVSTSLFESAEKLFERR